MVGCIGQIYKSRIDALGDADLVQSLPVHVQLVVEPFVLLYQLIELLIATILSALLAFQFRPEPYFIFFEFVYV
jgi:hypothetical protein